MKLYRDIGEQEPVSIRSLFSDETAMGRVLRWHGAIVSALAFRCSPVNGARDFLAARDDSMHPVWEPSKSMGAADTGEFDGKIDGSKSLMALIPSALSKYVKPEPVSLNAISS